MGHDASELTFLATLEKGEVSALLIRPAGASHLLVLGHGASSTMRHATLQAMAEAFADADVATFRYNFPYAEHGKGRDSHATKSGAQAFLTVPLFLENIESVFRQKR